MNSTRTAHTTAPPAVLGLEVRLGAKCKGISFSDSELHSFGSAPVDLERQVMLAGRDGKFLCLSVSYLPGCKKNHPVPDASTTPSPENRHRTGGFSPAGPDSRGLALLADHRLEP